MRTITLTHDQIELLINSLTFSEAKTLDLIKDARLIGFDTASLQDNYNKICELRFEIDNGNLDV